ncbi:MAG: NAD(P)H dehydrogenase (quinone) [Zhongshania sp.]|jgi:NAD(P)H dehydrogenase (quinone)
MNVLIVHAHPEPKSFSSALYLEAKRFFEEKGDSVQVSDLYAMDFNPVASSEDFAERADPDYFNYALEQRKSVPAGTISTDIKIEIEKVEAADLLVFNFPLYWFSTPAILKGWIDRVFVSGKFYGGKRIYGNGGMAGKKALVSVSTGGRDDMLSEGGIHGDINEILKPLLQGSLGYVGMDVLEPFHAFHVPYVSAEVRLEILDKWRSELANLDERKGLAMPNLSKFDEYFFPIT